MVQNATMVALHSSKCDHGAATIMVYATIETQHCPSQYTWATQTKVLLELKAMRLTCCKGGILIEFWSSPAFSDRQLRPCAYMVCLHRKYL